MAFKQDHFSNHDEKDTERKVFRRHAFQYWWVRALAVLASIVVFCTVYALILPATAVSVEDATSEEGFFLEASPDEGVPDQELEAVTAETIASDDGDVFIAGTDGSDEGTVMDINVDEESGDVQEGDPFVGTEEVEEAEEIEEDITEEPFTEPEEEATVPEEEIIDIEVDGEDSAVTEEDSFRELIYSNDRDSDFDLAMIFRKELNIPETAIIELSEIKHDSAEFKTNYEAVTDAAAKQSKAVSGVRFFNITLYDDGKEFKLPENIRFEIRYHEENRYDQSRQPQVFHFNNETNEYTICNTEIITENNTEVEEGTEEQVTPETYKTVGFDTEFTGLFAFAEVEKKETEAVNGSSELNESKVSEGDSSEKETDALEESVSEASEAETEVLDENDSEASEADGSEETAVDLEESDSEVSDVETESSEENTAKELVFTDEDFDLAVIFNEEASIPATALLQLQDQILENAEFKAAYAKVTTEFAAANKAVSALRFFTLKIMDGEDEIALPENISFEIRYHEDKAISEGRELEFITLENGLYAILTTEQSAAGQLIVSEKNSYNITMEYAASAGIPSDASLSVREILPGTDEYASYLTGAQTAVEDHENANGEVSFARFFDITILNTSGQEITPAAAVSVNITFPKQEAIELAEDGSAEEVLAVHFDEENDSVDLIETETNGTKSVISDVSFEAETFSVYGVIYTVDFHWEVNGKIYKFSIPGGGFVSLTDLAEVLGIADGKTADKSDDEVTEAVDASEAVDTSEDGSEGDDGSNSDENGEIVRSSYSDEDLSIDDTEVSDATRTFVADIESVEFSSPALLSVSKVEENTTVGALKENLGLECQYSTELTKEQIEKINDTEVQAGDWALISILPFETEEKLTVTMKTGEVFTIKVTDAQLKQTVISASGDIYEITVTFDNRAQIPSSAELKVREIIDSDEDYTQIRRDIENGLIDDEVDQPVNPVLFDISIWDGEKEIEPKEGSEVKVEVKLVRSALKGMFSDEDTPLLINDAPIQVENGYVEKCLQVIHQEEEGVVSVMDSFDNIGDEQVVSTFSTSSFSNWLVFLDEEAKNITIGVGDIITLRPYKEWSWDDPSEQGDSWQKPEDNQIFKNDQASERSVYDSNMDQTYTIYEIEADQTGEFDIQTTNGRTIHVIVQQTSPEANGSKPATVNTVNNADEGITFNLYDYDEGRTLDESSNKAQYWKDWNNNDVPTDDSSGNDSYNYQQNLSIYHPGENKISYDTSVNYGHYLKFLGWGYSGKMGDSWAWSKHILDYSGTTVTPGIVAPDLVEVTLSNGTKIKVPELKDFDEDLSYLFNPTASFADNNHDGAVQAYPNANGLFQKGGNGYYYYNSNSNYAWYNPNTNSFEVYEHTYQQHTSKNSDGNGKPIGFYPFHEYEPDTDTDGTHSTDNDPRYGIGMNHNKYLDHHFGMDMAVEFAIPEDGLDEYGNPITFEFSGDDDLWVFVDDKLVLDVGGVHQPVTASINFSNDAVKVTGQSDTTISAMMGSELEKGVSVHHTMRVYYMERGGCDSNLSIRFNLPTTLGKGELRVIKNDSKTPEKTLGGATFGLYLDEHCENLISGKEKTSGDNGLLNFGELAFKDVNTTYYLKEITAPEGYLVDAGVYQVKPYVLNGEVQKDSNGYVVLQVIAPDGTALAQTNPTNLALSSIEFPNEKVSEIDIPAEKKWKDNVVTDTAQITLTIKRYKLVGQTKGLTIEQNLIGKPDSHAFQADYTITYTTADGEKRTIFVDYTKFKAGRYTITDIEPGEYTIVQNIRSGVPDNYTRTDDPENHQKTVTLSEDGSVTAQFNSTYVQKTGTLNLKAVVSNIPSGVSYDGVRYAILDSNGRKVRSTTYQEIMNGKNFILPVGTYSIKAVNIPKDSDENPATRTVTKDGVTVENATISVGNVSITDGGTTSVQFNNVYSAVPKAANCTWRIVEQYDNNTVYASGNVADSNNNWFNEGQSVRLSFSLDPGKYYGSLHTITYNGQTLTASDDGTWGNQHYYHVDFTAVKNAQLVIQVNRNKGTSTSGFVSNTSITANRSLSLTRDMRALKGGLLTAAGENNEEIHETNPADAHTVIDPDTQEQTNVPANLPDAPAYKKYVKDVDPNTGNDWQRTIVLNKDNTPEAWKDTLKNLEASDIEGNPYYYYVAAVDETGLAKVTTVSFGNNGDELLLIGKDNLDGNTLNVTNTVKLQGALALTKIVTLNGVDNTTDMTNGVYSFTITGLPDTETAGISHSVSISFENGRAISYTVDGSLTPCRSTDNSWTVVLQELTAGDYVITENLPTNENMVLTSITGGKNDGDKDARSITVTVHPGDEVPENEEAKATFINDRTEKVTITVKKKWEPEPLDTENPSITVKLHRYAKKTKGTINITLKDYMPNVDDHVSAPIEGARFRLYEVDSPDGPWTETSTIVTTDVNGNASVSQLSPGKSYKLVQISTPQRYSFNTNNPPASQVLTVQDNSIATQEISTELTNEALVTSATVTLTLSESSAGSGSTDIKIDGAKFKLYKDGALYRTDEYVTSDGGKIIVSGLPAGEYYFVQTSTPTQYRMPADPKTTGFTVEDKPWVAQNDLTQSMNNDLKGKGIVTVTLKKDSENGVPIANAEFQLRQGDDLFGRAYTDEYGVATFTDVYEGSYSVHQVNAGVAADDGYEIDPGDKAVSIEANSITDQSPSPIAFVNECNRGNVTIHLWVKQGKDNKYNWEMISDLVEGATFEYPYLKAGETYSFTSVFLDGLYSSNNVWTYWDTGEQFTFEHDYTYSHSLIEDNISKLNASNYNGGTYNFTFTIPEDAQDGTIYNLAMITGWGIESISSFAMNETRALTFSASAPQSALAQEPLTNMQQVGRRSFSKAFAEPIVLRDIPAVTEAQPNKPSDSDYFEDTINFTPIEHTIYSAPWEYQFPAQDKYDPNGEPYYYYVEETASTPDEYVIASYVGDPVFGEDTGEITITNTRSLYGSLKLNKNVTVNGEEPQNDRDWALAAGDYTFTVKDSEQSVVKNITLHVDNTGVSLLNPTDDAEVTLMDGVVTIAKLATGNYCVEEITPTNGTTLSNVTVNTSGSVNNSVASVTINDKNQQTTIPLVTFTNNINTSDLSLTKTVAGEGAEQDKSFEFTVLLTAPSGQTLADSYTFKKNSSTAEGIIYTKDENNAAKATVSRIALKHNEVFTIEDLPEGTTYVILENDYSSDGYSSSIPATGYEGVIGNQSEIHVTNTLSAGDLTVEKTIEGNAADPTKKFDFSITFNKSNLQGTVGSYKVGTQESIESATPVDIIFNNGRAVVTFQLKGGEKAEFSGLLIGTAFTVSETSRDTDGYETSVSSTGGTVQEDKTVTGSIAARIAVTASYLNKKNVTTAEATKEWKSGSQTIKWPKDVEKVEFTLYKTVNGSTTQVVGSDLTYYATAEQIDAFQNPIEITSSTDDKKAVWNNLPVRFWLAADANADPAVVEGWYDATYTVKETKVVYTAASGKDPETKDISAVNNVITNEIEKVQVHASKQWKDKNGNVLDGTDGKAYPANAEVTFALVKDGTVDDTQKVVLNGVDETKNPDTGETITPENSYYEGPGWTAWFTELPKYTAGGDLIDYSVKETVKMAGYEIEGSDTVNDDGTIINKEMSVDINILKVDKTDGSTPLAGAKFVLKRFNEGYYGVLETWLEQEVGSTGDAKGTLKFEKVAIGYYELEETEAPPGYIKTSANPRFEVKVDTNGTLKVEFENSEMVTYEPTTKTFTVKNEPGSALPNAGGTGTNLIYLIGLMLIGLAGAGFVTKRRRRIKTGFK